MKVQASNGRKFYETGFPLIVIRACFTNKMLKFMAKFATLLTNVCQSLVSDMSTGLVKAVVLEKEGMAVGRKCHDSA